MSKPSPVDVHEAVWRADALARPAGRVLGTGHATLDAQLPGGGWPVGALVEILQAHSGQNEWRLLLPALAHSGTAPVVLVGAPHMPFGPGLSAQGLASERLLWIQAELPAARMWACEQALRCTQVCAVLSWLPQVRADQLRRLQMAAGEHGKLLFVMRPARAQTESSPAVLRLLAGLQAQGDGITVDILKRRGPPATEPVHLPARAGRLAALLARSRTARQAVAVAPAGVYPAPERRDGVVVPLPVLSGRPTDALARVVAAA